jgi:hypothetical protein
MAFQPAPGVVSIEFLQTLSGEKTENVLHAGNGTGSAINEADIIALAEQAWTWWQSAWSAHVGNNLVLNSVLCTDLATPTGFQAAYGPTPEVGALSGPKLTNNASFSIKLSTGFRGRSMRGRWFVQGILESQLASENHVDATVIGQWESVLNSGLTSIVSGLSTILFIGVLSRRTAGALRPHGIITPANTWTAVDDIIDSQKRRLPAHNRHRR